jgi:hypothetical protein
MAGVRPQHPPAPHRLVRRARAAALIVALAGAGAVGGLAAASGSGAAAAGGGRVRTASLATFRAAMIARLHAQEAHFSWVVCVRSGAHFDGVPVVRCNVDFGDPHIQAYCSVFRGARLVTDVEDPAIPCRPDDAGYSQTITTYS